MDEPDTPEQNACNSDDKSERDYLPVLPLIIRIYRTRTVAAVRHFEPPGNPYPWNLFDAPAGAADHLRDRSGTGHPAARGRS
jgi:hypothetical protein